MRRASVAREREQMEEEKAEFPLGGKSTLESVGRKKKKKKEKRGMSREVKEEEAL